MDLKCKISISGHTGVVYKPIAAGTYSMIVQCCDEPVTTLPVTYKTNENSEPTIQPPPVRERSAKQTFGHSGGKFDKLSDPQDVAVDNRGHVIVSDSRNHRIQVWNSTK